MTDQPKRIFENEASWYGKDFSADDYRLDTFSFGEKALSGLGIKNAMSKSDALWERGKKVIPCGTQTLGKSPIGFIEGVAPKYLSHGDGGRVWDVDGNEYIDCWLACLPITFGHRVKEIDEAVARQMSTSGITFSLMHPLEVEVAESLREDISIAEQVRFAKNGSDVCEAAIRLARHLTRRDKVVTLGYHGFHDWYISSTDRSFGIPQCIADMTLRFNYNDIDGLKHLFDTNKGEIACVMMEPAIFDEPQDNFLAKVKELCHKEGALLIFDEMLTGYRFSRNGAMSFFGVEPDLATFGKGIANGMPIGMLVGPEKYMRGFEEVFLSSTYGGETTALAAALAGLEYHRQHDVVGHMWRIGKIVLDNFKLEIDKRDLGSYVSANGYPVRQALGFKDADGRADYDLAGLYQQEMLKNGVLCNAGLGFCHRHDENDAMHVVRSFAKALDRMKQAIDEGDIKKHLEGKPAQPVFKGLRNQRATSN
ncbi:MAG: aminotransferase class III-fold pyridoxal phosphate-dependent enzyme [Magnetovibrio sp.]|nr:aminotransferase class III-fold pyridoxal phosphate-dependent enzyme [Magnetovibrio sp.]